MEATAGTKPTFEQRREKELDDILHALQATVQKMEQDCFPGHSTTWQAYSQSAKLMDGRGHCFSLSSDDSLGNSNFVAPPLPPPPTEEDLASFSGESSSSQKTSSPTPLQTVVSPTYKASANFSVWSPGGGKNTSEPQGTYGGSKSSSTAPAGFRKVSRPISKKSDKSPSSSSVTTSYHFPGNVLPEPSESVKVTPKNGLPDGAVYETKTVDGDMVHTDTYYPAPGDSTVLERTKKTTVIKAEHHHGMGPTDDHGVPTALRSTVDNPKAWYKNMFKQIHKVDQEGTDDQNHYSSDGATEEPMKSQVPLYKPKRLGKITDYTPSDPYVVESKPSDNRIPKASTSYNPTRDQFKKPEVKSSEEPVHGTEYAVKDYPMADHVVIEPKHVVTMNLGKQKDVKKPEESKRIPARAKFDFHPQSNKQLGLKKKQIVIITKEVNKDWYEGETTDGKSHGMFPVAYVEVLSQTERKSQRKGVAKAKFDFNGTNAKQLSVKKGETIELIEKVDGNWYKASIGQRAGLVPANYLEIVSQPTAPQTESGAKSETKSAVSPTAKSPPAHTANRTVSSSLSNDEPDDEEKMSRASFLAHAVVNSGAQLSKPRVSQGEFDIPELSDEALGFTKRTNGNRDSHASVDTSSSSAASDLHSDLAQNLKIKDQETSESSKLPENDPQKHLEPHEIINDDFPVQREKFVAVYQYLPQNEDELELLHGDIVLVVEKCDDGWYVGTCERTGAFGTFPGNYVTPA